ncbi:MAG: lipocalin family protein [Rikenella sp.]|nr:lipocalin family protein [Rikenella sp.]
MKKLIYALLAFSLVTFVGCKKDDKQVEVNAANVEGTWEYTGYFDGELNKWEPVEKGYSLKMIFKAGGIGSLVETDDEGSYDESFTYKVENGRLKITDTDGYTESQQIKSLTKTELILISEEYTGDDGKKYQDTEHFKRK